MNVSRSREAPAARPALASTGQASRGFVGFADGLDIATEMAERAYKRDSHVTGVTTGLRDLDRKLGGLQKSDLVVLAGRPSMGKTALATNIAYRAAARFHETLPGPDGGRGPQLAARQELPLLTVRHCGKVFGQVLPL